MIQAALTLDPDREGETPSNYLRRRSAIRLLIESGMEPDDWTKLRGLLWEKDPEICIPICRMAFQFGTAQDRPTAIRRAVEVLPEADWFLQTEIRNWLVDHYEEAKPIIDGEMAQHPTSFPGGVQRILLTVKKLAEHRR